MWKDNGKPHNGYIADIRRKTRSLYHLAIRKAKEEKDTFLATKLANEVLENKDSFWKRIKQMKSSRSSVPNIMDNEKGIDKILDIFVDKYKTVYNSVGYNKDEMSYLKEEIDNDIRNCCCQDKCSNGSHNHSITVVDVQEAIKTLKRNKSEGTSQYKSDHIINGSPKLHLHIALLLTAMLKHGTAPNNMLLSTIIPIPKSAKKSVYSSNNYRGISLSSIIGKLLDKVILSKFADNLITSDHQFGFKSKHSTTKCTYIVKETIQYYMDRNTPVYTLLLDASQAFDRVEYIKLFKLLLDRNLCPLFARLLLMLYTNQFIQIRWGSTVSNSFLATNGVKQGGVLSPVLFAVYMDVLLEKLKKSKEGCHIGHTYMGSFGYADDVILLSPLVSSLQRMLQVANKFSEEYNVLFNATKFQFIVYDKDPATVTITFNNIVITSVQSGDHLGNILSNTPSINNIDKGINDLTCKFNNMLPHFEHSFYNVKYTVFKSFCMCLYGCTLWDFSSKVVDRFYIRWCKCIRRLLHLHPRTHSNLLCLICDDKDVKRQLHMRVLKFAHDISCSKNKCVQLCAYLSIHGSCSELSNSLNHISNVYHLDKYDVPDMSVNYINNVLCRYDDNCFTDHERYCAKSIQELLDMKNNRNTNFNQQEIMDLLEHFCTV